MRKLIGGLVGVGLLVWGVAADATAVSAPPGTLQFGPDGGSLRIADVARDAAGDWYVVGQTTAALPGETLRGSSDAFVAKVSAAGHVVWADHLGTSQDDALLTSVELDGTGVFVAGATDADPQAAPGALTEGVVRRYDPTGAVLWEDRFLGTGPYLFVSDAALVGGTLHVVASDGTDGFHRRYGADGTVLGSQRYGWSVEGVAGDGDEVFLVGTGAEGDAFVRRYGEFERVPLGVTWASPLSIVVTADGVYVSAQTWTDAPTVAVFRFDRSLDLQWSTQVAGGWMPSLAVDDAGNAYVAASDDGEVVLAKLTAEGTPAWRIELGSAWYDEGGAVSVSGDTVFVAGTAGGPLDDGAVGGGFIAGFPTVRTVPVTRIAGTDRIATAIAISQTAFPSAPAAVVASAEAFPDALVAGALGAHLDGPVLLTPATTPDDRVVTELRRVLGSGGDVLVVGGRMAVSDEVLSALRAQGHDVERVAGADRFSTAAAVARRMGSPDALLADGRSFPDALTAGAAAAQLGRAVLLTDGDRLPSATRQYLLQVRGEHLAVGGPASRAAPGAAPIVGADRWANAAEVAQQLFPEASTVGVASGLEFADGLAFAPLLDQRHAPLLLTATGDLPAATAELVGLHLEEVLIAGGSDAIGPAVEATIRSALTEGEQA